MAPSTVQLDPIRFEREVKWYAEDHGMSLRRAYVAVVQNYVRKRVSARGGLLPEMSEVTVRPRGKGRHQKIVISWAERDQCRVKTHRFHILGL